MQGAVYTIHTAPYRPENEGCKNGNYFDEHR